MEKSLNHFLLTLCGMSWVSPSIGYWLGIVYYPSVWKHGFSCCSSLEDGQPLPWKRLFTNHSFNIFNPILVEMASQWTRIMPSAINIQIWEPPSYSLPSIFSWSRVYNCIIINAQPHGLYVYFLGGISALYARLGAIFICDPRKVAVVLKLNWKIEGYVIVYVHVHTMLKICTCTCTHTYIYI